MPKISLVINTKNEEAFIADCISSAIGICDEVIVVDMHSTDATVEIAAQLGATIHYFEDRGFVEPARNFAIQQARNEWVLLLDADERLNPTLAELLKDIVSENKYESVRIAFKNVHFGRWTRHTGWWPDYHIRLFKKSKVTWGDGIHSVPEFSENFFTIPAEEELAITHLNFRSVDQLVAKIQNYSRHENNLDDARVNKAEDFINYFEGEFSRRYLEHEGYRDGLHGFMLSKFMEFYRFLEVARFWERNGYKDITDVDSLSKVKVDASLSLIQSLNESKAEVEKFKNWGLSLSAEYDRSKSDYADLDGRFAIQSAENEKLNTTLTAITEKYEALKRDLESDAKKVEILFNDDELVKLYYSKDWKKILKIYGFKKKYLSNDSSISQKINRFIDVFRKNKKYSSKSGRPTLLNTLQKNVDYSLPLTIPFAEEPAVSILIPVYNSWQMNYRCVKSIIENTTDVSYEIVFADDASIDETKDCSAMIENIVHIYNTVNLGFLKNCNNAALAARGDFILFLNNDTEVAPGWLTPLTSLMEDDPAIGLVGSKLIYPDGTLQEAGGIIWSDASGWNYGKHKDPSLPEFNYVKEVDYISGAAIMIRKSLWQKIGGFDERFAPAYFEDSDLAFSVRAEGYKVVYQPLSEVVHFESVSHGKDDESKSREAKPGEVSIQAVRLLNKTKFTDKWGALLSQFHFENGQHVFHARDRSAGKKTILVVDHYVPEFDKDAGSKTVMQYLTLFIAMGLNVKFLGDNFARTEPYTTTLQQMGVEVLYGKWYQGNWKQWVQENRDHIDFVFLNRPHTSLNYISFFKQHSSAKIFYYGHDLHFLRQFRQYELDKNPQTLASSNQWKSKEQFIYGLADHILSPSESESVAIRELDSRYRVSTILPYFFKDPAVPVLDFSHRKDILFVGGFGHPPNSDAVLWFIKQVWPIVSKELSDCRFVVIGSNPGPEITALNGLNIEVRGFVTEQELKQAYKLARIAIVPLRYGAGVKGKTVEAMNEGIPVVSTSIGLEGMPELPAYFESFDQPSAFAERLISLYKDEEELVQVSVQETSYINDHFTWQRAFVQLEELLVS